MLTNFLYRGLPITVLFALSALVQYGVIRAFA
jgi:hypothetical protein